MTRNLSLACAAVLSLTAGSVLHAKPSDYLSPIDVVCSADGKTAFVAAETGQAIIVFDLAAKKVTATIPLKENVSGLVLSADGATLYVTCGGPAGSVKIIDTKAGKVAGSIALGHTPGGPALSPDGKLLYVCNRFNNAVAIIDVASKAVKATVNVAREPFACVQVGGNLFVANHLPTGAANGDYAAAAIQVIDVATAKVTKQIALNNGSTGVRDICASADGKFVFATHILARYQLPTTQLERGWMNTNAVSIVDTEKLELLNTVLLDDVDLGAANPWGATCSSDGKYLFVATAGTHELHAIDLPAAMKKITEEKDKENIPNRLSYLYGIKRRIGIKGNGPRGVAVAGDKVVVTEYFSDSLAVVDLSVPNSRAAETIPLGAAKEPDKVRLGERYFNDADFCFQKWQSCGSCHPDVRTDALNWDLLNDGMGNPKQTKNLLLTHRTPPSMVTGVRPDAETAVRAGIRYIQFAVRPEEDAAAIDEFLKALTPVPSPYLIDGKLSPAAERGKKVFSDAGCASCHSGELLTDMQRHTLDQGSDRDKGREFDTPSLIEAWRTAPYMYDGRAPDLKSMLKNNPANSHGVTSKLNEKQIADLIEFVLSQ